MALLELPSASIMSEPPKIAISTGSLMFGGSTTFVLQLTSGFKALGVRSAVFSFRSDHPFAEEFAAAGIPVHLADERRFIYEDRMESLYQRIVEFGPTAVIANLGAEGYEMLRYMPPGVARIGVVHDLAMDPSYWISDYQDALDGLAVVNRLLTENVRRAAPDMKCEYLAHGIPLPDVSARDRNPSDPLKLIYFGRLYPGKGTRLFPGIVEELRKRDIPFQFRIHGTGPEESYLRESLASFIASGTVTLSTNVPRSELYPLIRQNDIFIMASEHEGGPLTLLEAMSLGLVPVCNDIPCLVHEVVHPDTGFRVARTPEAFAEAIAALHRDRAMLERLSAAARKTIDGNYTIESMARRYLEFIKSAAPAQTHIEWPAAIRPKPIATMPRVSQLAQRLPLVKPMRRILKKMKTTRPQDI